MDQDKKPEEAHISLRVKSHDGQETQFKIKRSTPFQKLFKAYADRVGKNMNSIKFTFDGARVNPEQCPNDLDLEDDDVIDAAVEQLGGQ